MTENYKPRDMSEIEEEEKQIKRKKILVIGLISFLILICYLVLLGAYLTDEPIAPPDENTTTNTILIEPTSSSTTTTITSTTVTTTTTIPFECIEWAEITGCDDCIPICIQAIQKHNSVTENVSYCCDCDKACRERGYKIFEFSLGHYSNSTVDCWCIMNSGEYVQIW